MMAYQDSFVALVIHNNQPLREIGKNGKRTCIIPFNEEYKLRFKNKKDKKVKVKVSIDGTDVLFGNTLVLFPQQEMELERFLNDMNSGNRFKFMSISQAEKEGKLQDPDCQDNGHIKIEVYEEKIEPYTKGKIPICNSRRKEDGIRGLSGEFTATMDWMECPVAMAGCVKTKGVTVEGSQSNQRFDNIPDFKTEPYPSVIDIWLEGRGNFCIENLRRKMNDKAWNIFNKDIAPKFSQDDMSKVLDFVNELRR